MSLKRQTGKIVKAGKKIARFPLLKLTVELRRSTRAPEFELQPLFAF